MNDNYPYGGDINYDPYTITPDPMSNVKSDTNKIAIGVIVAAVFAIVIAIANNNSKPLTKPLYVSNTYLYVILAILLTSLTFVLMESFRVDIDGNASSYLLCAFCFTILLIFAFVFTSQQQYVLRHIYYILFAIAIGVMLYPQYVVSKDQGILLRTIAAVIIMVIGLTFVANMFPETYFDSWGPILLTGLFGLIVFELLDLVFAGTGTITSGRYKIYAGIAVAIFSGYILYDTGKIYQRATNAIACVNYNNGGDTIENKLICTDYPFGSLGIFLDIINLFSSITTLQQ